MVMGCVFGLQEVYYRGLSSGDLGSCRGFLSTGMDREFSIPLLWCIQWESSLKNLHSRAALSVWRFERRM